MAESGERDVPANWLDGRMGSETLGGTWPVKHDAADLVRRILDLLPRSGSSEEALESILPHLRTVVDTLEAGGRSDRGVADVAGMADFLHVSPIVGFANAIAPPFHFELDVESKVARGHGAFRRAHEGGPGIVHGGLLAATVDELLGMATTFAGQPGMTGRLSMRYHHPTPILEELVMEARLDRQEGRRLFMTCDVHAGDTRTASAEAVFIVVGREKFADLDTQRQARESTD